MRDYDQYIEDISQLTGLPKKFIISLMKVFRIVVGHQIYESIVRNDKSYEVYLVGFGKLTVEYNPETDDYNTSIRLSRDMKSIIDKILDEQSLERAEKQM